MKLRKHAVAGNKRYKQRWWGHIFVALALLIMGVGVIGSAATPAALAGPALDQPGQGDQDHQGDQGHQGDKGDRGDKGDKREVPNVAGLSQADAEAALKAADLKIGTVTEASSDSVPAGLVISQTPAAGERVKEEDRIDLVISSGPAPAAATEPAMATVPDLTNNTQADAEAALTAAGLVLGAVSQQSSDTVPAGAVISQNPAAGSSANPGAAVDIVVSSGPAVITVTVPNVVNLPQADAEAAIVAASLVTGTVTLTNSDTIAAGLVMEQNPAADSTVNPGSAVDLVVSSGAVQITVTVPDVVNLPQADAEAAIVAAGLITGSTTLTPSDTITAGLVMEQNPAAGSTVNPGSAVDVVVSQGPAANIVVAAGPTPVDMTGWTEMTLDVISARTEGAVNQGDPITQFKYIINVDNTGTTDQRGPADGCSPEVAGYPGTCFWTSIAGVPGSSPIFTQGNQDDFNGVNGVFLIPDGRYLISVLADGFKLDGIHFTIPAESNVTVELQPNPLPAATIQAAVFEDNATTNGAPDVPVERGLAGFQGHIADYLGEVTTDVFGDPLCGNGVCLSQCYVVDGGVDIGTVDPVDGAGHCPADVTGLTQTREGAPIPATAVVEGKLEIPNLGPNRYALSITPPDGTNWIQTTTLEGNHDWDSWVMEGATGLDTEFVVAGEPFPFAIFGYVQPNTPNLGGSGHIKGVVEGVKVYVPAKGGLGLPGTIWGGLNGAKLDAPIDHPWISLNDLTNGDQAIWVGQGDANGAFDIPNVPDGNYTLTWWDEPQNYILDLLNVTVTNGEVVDMGILPLTGWWTRFEGYVFNDTNRNGVKDSGEPGIPNFTLTMRKRENSLMDRGATTVTTDASGYYVMENAYPMTQWLVMEAYNDLYYTTGITYQADNQPTPTTVLGAGVDVSVLPIIGLSGRMDWGVHAYDPTGRNGIDPRNGGIVGTVSYDTTRNELDPQYAAVEDWQPGVSGLTVDLYETVDCGTHLGAPCDATDTYELAADGSYAKGKLLNTYVTESWQRPTENCVPRDVDGSPLAYPADQQVTNSSTDCLEGPLMGVQFGPYATDQGTPDANFGAAVDGNYGFGDGCFNGSLDATDPANPVCKDTAGNEIPFDVLPGGREYLVEVETAYDQTGMRPLFQFTREEDINIANGDQFVPQVPPPACAGPLHTVDVAGFGADGYGEIVGDGGVSNNVPVGVTVPASTPVDNATFLDIGASPYEGMPRPLCNVKLVQLNNGKSIVPTFNVFTEVPVPGRFWGLIVDDLNFSSNPKSLLYGEKAGVPFAPVGIYDWTNRLVGTVESDYNGLWDVLLPSTNRISCPTPSGVCANLYRFVGNDPGIPGRLNPNYNPQFRTISAEFEAFPGLLVPADLAPTQVGVTVQLPGSQFNTPVSCSLDAATPQLFAVSQP